MVQKASDRRKDDLIGKKEVLDIRRIRRAAQDDETKSARSAPPVANAGNQSATRRIRRGELRRPATSLSSFVQYHLLHEK